MCMNETDVHRRANQKINDQMISYHVSKGEKKGLTMKEMLDKCRDGIHEHSKGVAKENDALITSEIKRTIESMTPKNRYHWAEEKPIEPESPKEVIIDFNISDKPE